MEIEIVPRGDIVKMENEWLLTETERDEAIYLKEGIVDVPLEIAKAQNAKTFRKAVEWLEKCLRSDGLQLLQSIKTRDDK